MMIDDAPQNVPPRERRCHPQALSVDHGTRCVSKSSCCFHAKKIDATHAT